MLVCAPTDLAAPSMPTALTDPEYLLRGVTGAVFGRNFPLYAPLTVGRAPECGLYLEDSGISRQHARLRPLDYGVEVEDLGSTNGTFVNGHRVTVGIAAVGDEIAFDQLRFRVDARRSPNAAAGRTTQAPAHAALSRPSLFTRLLNALKRGSRGKS